MAPQRRVGIFIPNGPAYFARVFAGIGQYIRGRHHWQVLAWPSMSVQESEAEFRATAATVDGVIGRASALWESIIAERRLPFVNVEYSRLPFASLPRVGCDEVAIAREAAEHFRSRGVRHLAAVKERNSLPAVERVTAFVEAAAGWCPSPVATFQIDTLAALDQWLIKLPRPIGIFCWNDETSKHVHQQCHANGLRIPDDVSILGVDNDETICHFVNPDLSSIDANAQRIGYEAAALLDRLMDGRPWPEQPILVPPIGLVTRASTEMMAVDSPDVSRAIQFIRDRAGEGLTVKDVLDHLAISRRSLERQFQQVLGRSPRSEIHRVLVERAKDLLANTDLDIPAIADRCGYQWSNHFTTMFRKQTGKTPTAYRRQTRLTG